MVSSRLKGESHNSLTRFASQLTLFKTLTIRLYLIL